MLKILLGKENSDEFWVSTVWNANSGRSKLIVVFRRVESMNMIQKDQPDCSPIQENWVTLYVEGRADIVDLLNENINLTEVNNQ